MSRRVRVDERNDQGSQDQDEECRKTYLPGVIEPSFGVGRILYAIMEHSFSTRPQSDEDKKKSSKGCHVLSTERLTRQVCRFYSRIVMSMKANVLKCLVSSGFPSPTDSTCPPQRSESVTYVYSSAKRENFSLSSLKYHCSTIHIIECYNRYDLMNSVCPLSSRSILRLSTRQNANLRIVSILSL